MPAEFTGFPSQALDFYDDLEIDNTKSFWEAHKALYDDVRPSTDARAAAALAQEFGDGQGLPARSATSASRRTRRRTRPTRAPSSGRPGHRLVRRDLGAPASASAPASTTRGTDAVPRSGPPSTTTAPGNELARMVAKLEGGGSGQRAGTPQDHAPRVRRRPPAHRPAAAQVADARARLRLRAGHPHPGAARGRPRRLAHPQAVRRLGHRRRVSPGPTRAPRCQWGCQASSSSVWAATPGGRWPVARSSTVTCSKTSRSEWRAAIQTCWRVWARSL